MSENLRRRPGSVAERRSFWTDHDLARRFFWRLFSPETGVTAFGGFNIRPYAGRHEQLDARARAEWDNSLGAASCKERPDGTLWMIEERALTKVGLLWDAYYDAIRASGRGGRMPPAPQGEPCPIGEPVIGIRRRETQLQTPQT